MEALKPAMLAYVIDAVLLVAKPLHRVFAAEPFDDGDGRLCDVAWEVDLIDAAQNDVVDLHGVAGRERGSEDVVGHFRCCRTRRAVDVDHESMWREGEAGKERETE